MSGPATPTQFHFFLLFQLVLYSTLDCCAPSFRKMRPRFWWTPAWGHGFRPSSVPRQILPEGNYAVRLFWKMTGLRRKTVFLKKVCATDWSTIVWPRWMSPLSPYTTSRCVENCHFGFLRHRFRIENWQERVLLDSIQKGPPDIPAWFHAPIETFLVSRLCKTPITPNQLTLFCNVVAWTVTILLVTGHLAWGLGLALIVGVLDGLDGKLARLKLETSKAGKLEHLFDALFENSWWAALAWHLSVSGKLPDAFAYLGLLIGAEVLNALARASIVRYYGKSITELASFDRIFRLVGGRRNIYVWILALGLILGTVAGAFKLIAWWEAVTAAVHLARVASALWALRSQSCTPLDSTRLLLLRVDRFQEG